MHLPPIANDDDHAMLLDYLAALMIVDPDPPPDSDLGLEMQAVATALEAYEKIRWPIGRGNQ